MELQDWRKEPRKKYSNEFKLRMVELASQPRACVAQIARENGVNDNVIFKWLRLWQNEGHVSRRLPVTTCSCKVEFRHGNMTLENPSPELLTMLIRELSGRGR
ncbi:transposase [Escherichia coli]|uniref:transposase n=1 Tax=Escherichia coli TaxID=562 RepID=UPI0010CB542A|nr:transposase [Escherichia coli]